MVFFGSQLGRASSVLCCVCVLSVGLKGRDIVIAIGKKGRCIRGNILEFGLILAFLHSSRSPR